MAEHSGIMAVVILVVIILGSLYLFFDVLGWAPATGSTGATSAH